jgi:hypothetical protein
MSANAWRTLARVLFSVATPALLIGLAMTFLHLIHGANFFWFIPIFGLYCALFIVLFFATARAKKEVSAGYTTLWGADPELPQLDPGTGLLIRRPGEVYVKKADWKRATVPIAQPAATLARPTLWQRLLPSLPSGLGLAALIIFSGIYGQLSNGFGPVIGTTISVGIPVLVILMNSIAILVARARLARLRAVVPHDFLFMFKSTRDFREGTSAMKWHGGVEGPSRTKGVSADTDGMTIWQGNPPVQGVAVLWSSVVSIQADRVSQDRTTLPSVLVSYRDETGGVHALQLVNANADWLPLRSMPEVRWIASELNALRTANITARIL